MEEFGRRYAGDMAYQHKSQDVVRVQAEAREAASDFYLELKTLAQDCDITELGSELILCPLLVRGLLGSEEKLRERTIFESE